MYLLFSRTTKNSCIQFETAAGWGKCCFRWITFGRVISSWRWGCVVDNVWSPFLLTTAARCYWQHLQKMRWSFFVGKLFCLCWREAPNSSASMSLASLVGLIWMVQVLGVLFGEGPWKLEVQWQVGGLWPCWQLWQGSLACLNQTC